MPEIQPYPWQSDTSNGDWFYKANDKYKSTADVLHALTDIVSKNGNLLLNIVLKPDGTLPPESKELLDGLSAWMAVNSESIFSTRPWVIYGEGPTAVAGGALKEKSSFTAQDIRFTAKAGVLYAFCLGVPKDAISIKALAKNNPYGVKGITGISLLGSSEKINWRQGDDALVIQPARSWPTADEVVFKIEGALPPS
jgi:alpha-L-fucosidase